MNERKKDRMKGRGKKERKIINERKEKIRNRERIDSVLIHKNMEHSSTSVTEAQLGSIALSDRAPSVTMGIFKTLM